MCQTERPDTYHIDTSNVLFILSGAFVGLDTVVKRRVSKGVCFLIPPFIARSYVLIILHM